VILAEIDLYRGTFVLLAGSAWTFSTLVVANRQVYDVKKKLTAIVGGVSGSGLSGLERVV
jgi:hypothetical protein